MATGPDYYKVKDRLTVSGEVERAPAAKSEAANEAYGRLPLHFEANQGQTDQQVKFLSRGAKHTLFLTPAEAVLVLTKQEQPAKGKPEKSEKVAATVLRMTFVGANPEPRVAGREELPGKANYFIGNDSTKWRTNVPTYAKVQYQELYPGIDLIYHGSQRQLEYDVVLAPGADPGVIALGVQGVDQLEVDAQGELVLHTADGIIRQRKPFIYQEIEGTRREIVGGYILKNSHEVGFEVAAYDRSQPLVIDPVLVYSTYLGGSGDDYLGGRGIAVDSLGNAYVTGSTQSTDFPIYSGAFQPTFGGGRDDAFVTKLNPTGSALIYSTYLGGSGTEFYGGSAIALDALGNAYVTGSTDSSNFPTTAGAFQTIFGGGPGGENGGDAFVTKLNPSGNALVYSTYLGGSGGDVGFGIAVDALGNAYVTGQAGSSFPTTSGAFQTTFGGSDVDCFVTKLNPSGTALVYSTYLGGSGHDGCLGVAVDAFGYAYVSGSVNSTNFPTTSGAFQTSYSGASASTVTKLNHKGTKLVYSTYLGGGGSEAGYGIAIDALGNAYVGGSTNSSSFPTTTGAFQTTFGGGSDGFVTKLNPSGSALIYSTYLGGSDLDAVFKVSVDALGNAYVTGVTRSTNFPTTLGAFQTSYGGGADDAFVTKLNPAGAGLVYSTYLGGSGFDDEGFAIALDALGNAYVTGLAGTNFPTTSGAFQPTFGGGSFYDAFVAKFGPLPFATFTVKVAFTLSSLANNDTFNMNATFTLGTGNNGIAPPTEDVLLQIGTFSATIPAGSFKLVTPKKKPGFFTFTGPIGKGTLDVKITPLGGADFEFKAIGSGLNLAGAANPPMRVGVTIGDDGGSTIAN